MQGPWLRSNSSVGFTLVELVLVIALLGILGAVAFPKFFTLTPYTNRFFYDDVRSSLRYAEKYAVGTGCHTQVNITATTLTLNRRSNCTSGSFTAAVVDPSNPAATSYTRTAPTGITMTTGGGSWPFYFDALGVARQVSDTTINTFTVTVGTQTITVYGMTGYVQ